MIGPFRDFSAITVYHPNSGEGNAFASVGFLGFVGGLTGVSEKQMGISEIGASYPDASFGSESRVGYPFIFLLRDILQSHSNSFFVSPKMVFPVFHILCYCLSQTCNH